MKKSVRALIIGMDDRVTAQVSSLLIHIGYTVDRASTGYEGIFLASKEDYDVIFVGLSLLDMSSFDVANNIRQLSLPYRLFVPIIMLTEHFIEVTAKSTSVF